MAQRFNETVNLQPVDTSTGAAQAALSLADQLEGFKTQSLERARGQAVKRGEASAAGVELTEKDGITQAPKMKREGFFGEIESISHNKALRGAYLASLSNDINESVTAIEAENADNILKFNDSSAGLAKGILSGVDPASRQQVATFLESKVSAARGRVHARNLAKDKATAAGVMATFAQNTLDDANAAARAGDRLTSAEMLNENRLVNAAMVDSDIMTQTEADIKNIEAEFSTTKEFLVGGIAAQTQAGNYGDAIESIQKFREKIPKGFTIDQHGEVVTAMMSELRESLALNSKVEDIAEAELKATQANNYSDLYSGMALGTHNASDVISAMKTRGIDGTMGAALLNVNNTRGQGTNSWPMINSIVDDILSGVDVTDTLARNTGTNLTGAKGAELMEMQAATREAAKKARAAGVKSIYQSDDYKQATSFLTSMMRVTGFAGALDTEAEQRLGQSKRELFEAVGRGENPWIVVDELIPKDDFNKRPNPRFGSKADLIDAQAKTDEAFLTKQIDEATYNFQTRNIQALTDIQQTLTEYNKAKKDALENATKR